MMRRCRKSGKVIGAARVHNGVLICPLCEGTVNAVRVAVVNKRGRETAVSWEIGEHVYNLLGDDGHVREI